MDKDYDYIFKVVVIGDADVGKTKVVQQFCDRSFSDTGISTIGIDFSIKRLKIGLERLKFQIWVTTGQERFRTLTRSNYKSTDVFILVYDITSQKSFQSINKWLQEIQEFCGDAVFKVLIGNNCDKQEYRQVSTADGNVLAERENMPFLEISAKDNSGIDQLLQNLGKQLLAQKVGKLKQSHGRRRAYTEKGEDSLCERREGGFGRKWRSKSTLQHIPSIKDSSKILRTESDRIPTFPSNPRDPEPVRIPIKTPSLDSPFIKLAQQMGKLKQSHERVAETPLETVQHHNPQPSPPNRPSRYKTGDLVTLPVEELSSGLINGTVGYTGNYKGMDLVEICADQNNTTSSDISKIRPKYEVPNFPDESRLNSMKGFSLVVRSDVVIPNTTDNKDQSGRGTFPDFIDEGFHKSNYSKKKPIDTPENVSQSPSLDSPFINQDVSIDRFRDNLPSAEVEFNLEQLDIVEPGSYVETVRENVRVSRERINEIIARSHQKLDEKKTKLLKSLDDYMAEVNKRVADLLQTRVQYAKSMEDFDATLKDNTAQDAKVGILKILKENIEKVDKQIEDLDVHKLRVVESNENYPCYISKVSRKFRTPKWCGIDKGTELNKLYDPHSIAVDTAFHRLYIADHAMHRIQVFDLAGKYIQTFSNAHTSFPVYLSLIESGLLISSPNRKKLVTISKESGAFQTEKSFPQGLVGIDYDPTTNLVYACTVNTNKLYCLDAELNSYETQLDNAHGTHTHPRNRLAIDCKVRNNELYVLFPYRDQPLHIFTLNGEMKRSILSRDYLHFGFRLNFTKTGGIVVSDLSAMQVKIFSQEGEPVGMIGERGEGRGRFYQPTGVAVTPDDVIVVCDLKNAFMLQAF